MNEASAATPALFDSHCHLGLDSLREDLENVLARARDGALQHIVDIGISVATSEQAQARGLALSQSELQLHPSAGLHPCDCAEHQGQFSEIAELAAHERCVAIGETGLDLYWDSVPLAVQRASLDKHIELGRALGKPLVLHCRDAWEELFEQLAEQAPIHGVLHCFTGDRQEAERCLELGLMVSFGGPLTYKGRRNDPLREAAAAVPEDRLLIETDAPFLPPQPWRGKRNEPAYVRATFDKLCDLRGAEPGQLAERLMQNSLRFFGLDAD
ncbi:MAG: hypothetical protein CSA62_03450 [Planctomycetota bacterium]|nr:MAG: hypothetical protein CSA62_03450 [Planctomycetota bacterium]